MLILISDLHLTDGSFDYDDPVGGEHISHDVSPEAFKLFWERIAGMIKRHNAESDRAHQIKEVNVVLLGDIFEMRSTQRWVASDYNSKTKQYEAMRDRPWREGATPSATCQLVLDKILTGNPNIKYLTSINSKRYRLQPALARLKRQGVTVRFEYYIGNHDAVLMYHAGAPLLARIKNDLGWKVPARTGSPTWDEYVRYANPRLAVVGEHGHRGDSLDYFNDYREPPLGALLSDTLGRLMFHIQNVSGLPSAKKKALVSLCMHIDNVRPSSSQFKWLLGNIPNDPQTRDALRGVLLVGCQDLLRDSKAIVHFALPRLKEQLGLLWTVLVVVAWFTRRSTEDLVNWLAERVLRGVILRLERTEAQDPLDVILRDLGGKVARFLPGGSEEAEEERYRNCARQEAKDSSARAVVFGHTHNYEICPLETVAGVGVQRSAFYFNSGTWKRTLQKNLYPPRALDFQEWTRMTYVTFYDAAKKEYGDHVFDLWHGDLGRG